MIQISSISATKATALGTAKLKRNAIAAVILGTLAFAPSCTSTQNQSTTSPQLQTTSGTVTGTQESNGVIVFKGIPYAAAPVGNLRWAPPQNISWDAPRAAVEFSPACQQSVNEDGSPNYGGYAGPVSEDCLYLNVWAPKNAKNAPIMVWLYGGGGVVGAGSLPSYDGTSFAENGVILVTLNYRHGALAGFAHPALTNSFGEDGPKSNFQLLDAVAALKWVHSNASTLGGDIENVTLFGESAGATMTANLVTSPLAKDLFAKAIFESTGSLAAPGTPLDKAEQMGAKIATAFGLAGDEATLKQLRQIDADELIKNRKLWFGFRTVIDGTVKRQSILDSFESGTQNDVVLMLGTNSDEGRLSGTRKIADLAESNTPVFQYFFDYVPEALREISPNGAPHAGEIPFVFNTLETYKPTLDQLTEVDRHIAEFTHSCWIAFAKAEPEAVALTCGNGTNWPARQPNNGKPTLVIKPDPEITNADNLISPPNGAEPGPTSRDGN